MASSDHPKWDVWLKNRLKGIVPTFSTFDVDPSSPAYVTDENFTTESGEGTKALGAPGTVGNILFDMGRAYPIIINAWINMHRASGDGLVCLAIDSSDDAITFGNPGVYAQGGKSVDCYAPCISNFLYTRYFRLRFFSTGTSVASVYHVKVAEVRAIQLL